MSAAMVAEDRDDAARDSSVDPFDTESLALPIRESSDPPPPEPAQTDDQEKEPFNWALLWARVKLWSWNVATKSIVTVVYLALISQGLRHVLPDISMRLYRLPGLSFLEHYTATYHLDLAHVFAAIPLLSAWILWHLNLEMYLRPEVFEERFRRWDVDRIKRVVITMGAIIIAGDAALFCAAVTLVSWGEAKLSAAAVLATGVYVTVLGFVTFVSQVLKDRLNALKQEEE